MFFKKKPGKFLRETDEPNRYFKTLNFSKTKNQKPKFKILI